MRIVAGFVLTIGLLWGMQIFLPQYITINGGIAAIIILAALLTLMNMFVRPFLALVTFPLHLLATLITTILVNLLFLWLLTHFADRLDPRIATFSVLGGLDGWLIVSSVLGLGHWLLKHITHAAKE